MIYFVYLKLTLIWPSFAMTIAYEYVQILWHIIV